MHRATRLLPDSAKVNRRHGATVSEPQEGFTSATGASRGVFDRTSNLFSRFRARMAFRDKLIGGVPKDPRLIEGWLRARAGLEVAQEIRQAMLRTLGEHGLYVEARQVKAMLKESTNVLFGGERWGSTRKGPRSFVAERVFVEPDKLWVGVDEPSGIELMIGHLWGPTGPRSTLGYHEYVERPVLEFTVLAVRDALTPEQWADIWVHAQENGFGALRSQGFGRFYL